jgi:hypothetical protein
MGAKKTNAQALAGGIVKVLASLDDPEHGGSIADLMPTIIGMIEEAWGAEEAQRPGTLTIDEACEIVCPQCRKHIAMHDGRNHLMVKDQAGPGHHLLEPCKAVGLRRHGKGTA